MKIIFIFSIFLGFCNAKSALLIIDVQNCFLPGGSLAVNDGDQVIPVINSIRDFFDVVVLTQDWHCPKHVSFASQHDGKELYDMISLEYDQNGALCRESSETCLPGSSEVKHKLNQTLWPDHCVIDTPGANLSDQIVKKDSDVIVRKGFMCEIDSYSAFYDNGRFSQTELDSKLKELDVDTVYISGLALDFCVFYSAMDAIHLGYKTFVIQDACRGITPDGMNEALEEMKNSNVSIVQSEELMDLKKETPGSENGSCVFRSFGLMASIVLVTFVTLEVM